MVCALHADMVVSDAILSAGRGQHDAFTIQLTMLSERAEWQALEGTDLHFDAGAWANAAEAHDASGQASPDERWGRGLASS